MRKYEFPVEEWFKIHLKEIKNKAGPRYTPKLNVKLPIAKIFDGIGRTKAFYSKIRKHYGNLSCEFLRITSKYKEKELQEFYEILKKEIGLLFDLLGNIKEYNTCILSWANIHERSKKCQEIINKIRKVKEQKKNDKSTGNRQSYPSFSERYDFDIHHFYNLQEELLFFEKFSLTLQAKLSNHPFLVLTGPAGIGKTHLLCDVVEKRIENESGVLPTILVFGEFFSDSEDVWQQIIKQLGIADKIKSKDEFLYQLNEIGEKSKTRSLLIIDALNETRPSSFWKNNLILLIEDVKKYPHIALVISVRTGFENEIFTEEQKNYFIQKEHTGFRFKEWEAVTKFFREFSLPLPEIPLLLPEFQNPLFLLLFCKAFERKAKENQRRKKQKQIFRGHEGATYIFENFVKETANKIASEFKLPKGRDKNGKYVIWDTIIEKIAVKIAEQGLDRIEEEKLRSIISSTYSSIDANRFIQTLERNLLITKVPRYSKDFNKIEGFDYRFTFQKFSDHLIGRYIFEKLRKSKETPEEFFAENTEIGTLIKRNKGVIEALSIQCPEQLKGREFVDVAPYLKDSDTVQESFIESLIWRNPRAFSEDLENTIKFINERIIRTEFGHTQLLNAFLSVAPIPEHPFNAEFLHKHLSEISMPKRDSWWSTFLHYQYGAREAVDRLIEWSRSNQDYSHINDESIFLICIALSWFLTTPNRFLRDKCTKGLVCLLQNRIHLILRLLEKFKSVNDLYVIERLFAVAYGCVLRNQDDKNNLKQLAFWIYENIFKDNKPPIHILLRDYARGVIEVALRRGIKLDIEIDKINPPYENKWPENIPFDEEIKKYEFDYDSKDFKDYFRAQNSIIFSIRSGDFGRYVFESHLSNWDTGNITIQQLSNLAIKMIFEEIGYDINLHGEFDIRVNYLQAGRSPHKPERIGKKYQWIAFHTILALVSDHFKFKSDPWRYSKEEYKGPWNPHIRDIDPSLILWKDTRIKQIPTLRRWKSTHGSYNAWMKEKSDLDWIKTHNDLPEPENIIQITDDMSKKWLILKGLIEWEEETPMGCKKYDIPARKVWYMIKSYIVQKKDFKKIFTWAKNQNFRGRRIPESSELYGVFLGEYPNSLAFEDLRGDFNIWTREGGINNILPVPVVVTDDIYLNEFTYDCSLGKSISIELPCKWLVNRMGLNHKYLDGRWFDKRGNLVVFAPSLSLKSFPSLLLINEKLFCDFLDKNGYAIFWILLSEKQRIGGYFSNREKWIGRLEINGLYKLSVKRRLSGELNIKFVKPLRNKSS